MAAPSTLALALAPALTLTPTLILTLTPTLTLSRYGSAVDLHGKRVSQLEEAEKKAPTYP